MERLRRQSADNKDSRKALKEEDKQDNDKLKKLDEARRAERQYQKGGRLEEVVNEGRDDEE